MPGWTPGPGPPKAGPRGGPASRWLGHLRPRREADRWKMLVGSAGHPSGVWREWHGGRAERTGCPTGCSWGRKRTAPRARHCSAGTSLGENRGRRRALGTGAGRWSAGAVGRDRNTALGKQVRREVPPSCPGLRVWQQVGKAREPVEEGVRAQSLWSGGRVEAPELRPGPLALGCKAGAARQARTGLAVGRGPGPPGSRALVGQAKRWACQEWDSNPRLQGRLRPERSALDRSAILTARLGASPLAWLGRGARRLPLAGGGVGAPGTGRAPPPSGSTASPLAWRRRRRRRRRRPSPGAHPEGGVGPASLAAPPSSSPAPSSASALPGRPSSRSQPRLSCGRLLPARSPPGRPETVAPCEYWAGVRVRGPSRVGQGALLGWRTTLVWGRVRCGRRRAPVEGRASRAGVGVGRQAERGRAAGGPPPSSLV